MINSLKEFYERIFMIQFNKMYVIESLKHKLDESDVGTSETTTAKATAMVVLFLASGTLGLLPIKLNKWLKWDSDPKNSPYVQLMLGFGGGVLLCTTFLHLLPEVTESFEEMELTPEIEIHYSELLMCIGFFTMYFVEECVHLYIHRRERLNSLSRRVDLDEKLKEHNLDHHHHHHPSEKHKEHSHIVLEDDDNDSTVKALRGLLVVLALSIHELFEGLAVGLESSSSNVWYMLGAVSAHKLVIAFCIGVELVTSGMKNLLIIIYVFTFAVVSPMGIGIGIAITSNDHSSTELVSVILQGLASGTLLYVVFFEILQTDRKSGLKQFCAVFFGFVVMFGITMLD